MKKGKMRELTESELAQVIGGVSIDAVMSRLESASNNLSGSENLPSAESLFRDADMAGEMAEFTRNNILMQAAQSMLSQANQQSQSVLTLLQDTGDSIPKH